jgi:hypothetical protein
VIALPRNQPVLSIKVHSDFDEYSKEAGFISAIITSLTNPDSPFYAMGGLPYKPSSSESHEFLPSDDTTTSASYKAFGKALTSARSVMIPDPPKEEEEEKGMEQGEAEPPLSSSSSYLNCSSVWNVIPLPENDKLTGGVILMRPGKTVKIDKYNLEAVVDGVKKSLAVTHAAGLCHCDIRSSNILKFDDEFQLIDYDLSVASGRFFKFAEGALFQNRGERLRSCSVGDLVYWTSADDYEMLKRFSDSVTKSFSDNPSPSTPKLKSNRSVQASDDLLATSFGEIEIEIERSRDGEMRG